MPADAAHDQAALLQDLAAADYHAAAARIGQLDPAQTRPLVQAHLLLLRAARGNRDVAVAAAHLAALPPRLLRDARLQFEAGQIARLQGNAARAFAHFAAAGLPGRYEQAMEAATLGRRDEACALLEALLAEQPQHAAAWRRLGQWRRSAGNTPAALEAFAQACAQAPGDPRSWRALAEVVAGQQGPAAALAVLQTAPPAVLADASLLLPRVTLLEAAGQAAAALALARDGLLRVPALVPLREAAIRLVLAGGALAEATAHVEALEDAGLALRWSQRLWRPLRRTGQLDEARRHVAALLQRRPAAEALLLEAGQLARLQGERRQAEAHFAAAAALPGAGPAPRRELAREAQARGDFAAARAHLDALLAAVPQDLDGWLLLGALLREADQPAGARAAYEQARNCRPQDPRAWRQLAELVARQDGLPAALQLLDRADAALGPLPGLAASRIDLLLKSGHDAAAAALLAAAEAGFADDLPIRELAIRHELERGHFAAALARLQTLPRRSPREAMKFAMLTGRYHELRWELDAAMAAYAQAMAADPENAAGGGALACLQILALRGPEGLAVLQETSRRKRGRAALRGRSANASQGLQGALLNELRTDPALLAAARAALAAGDAAALTALVRAAPHYTGAAIALLVQWRLARGRAAPQLLPAAPQRIPRNMVQYWNDEAVPPDLQEIMDSWPQRLPGWRYQRFSHRTALQWLDQHAAADVVRAYRRAREPARKSDILRLAVLQRQGGVYADADDRCLADLAPLLAGRSLVLRQEQFGTAGNNFIAVTAGHPVLGLALQQAVTATLEGYSETLWLETGPGAMTRALAQYLASLPDPHAPLGGEILLLDQVAARQHFAAHCSATYKFAGRHWVREITPV